MAEPEVQRPGNSEMQLKSKAVKKSCKYLLKQSSDLPRARKSPLNFHVSCTEYNISVDGRSFEEKEKRKEKLK